MEQRGMANQDTGIYMLSVVHSRWADEKLVRGSGGYGFRG